MIGVEYLNENYFIDEDEIRDTIISGKVFTNIRLNANYDAGSDITALFRKVHYGLYGQVTYSYMFKEYPDAGTYSFKVVLELKNGKIFESDTPNIELY